MNSLFLLQCHDRLIALMVAEAECALAHVRICVCAHVCVLSVFLDQDRLILKQFVDCKPCSISARRRRAGDGFDKCLIETYR